MEEREQEISKKLLLLIKCAQHNIDKIKNDPDSNIKFIHANRLEFASRAIKDLLIL